MKLPDTYICDGFFPQLINVEPRIKKSSLSKFSHICIPWKIVGKVLKRDLESRVEREIKREKGFGVEKMRGRC